MLGSTPMQTLGKYARSPAFLPFVIGFSSVMILSASTMRIKNPEAYLDSSNPRFSKPFLKRAGLDKPKEEGAH